MPSLPDFDQGLERLRAEIARGRSVLSLSGLTSTSSKSFIASQLVASTDRNFLILTDSNDSAEEWVSDLSFFIEDTESSRPMNFPSFEADPYAGLSPHAETEERRALTMWKCLESDRAVVIASAKSLLMRLPRAAEFKAMGVTLRTGLDLPPDALARSLIRAGYVREEPIKAVGEFSVRGGIMDVWPPDSAQPVRIEFFGDQIESLRAFDPETQLSVGAIATISLIPMREFSADPDDFRDWALLASEKFSDERQMRALADRNQFAVEGESFSGWEYLLPLIHDRSGTFFDFLNNPILLIDEPVLVEKTLTDHLGAINESFDEACSLGDLALEPKMLFLDGAELVTHLSQQNRVEFRALGIEASGIDEELSLEGKAAASELFGAAETSAPLFLFPVASVSGEFEFQSRPTRKFNGDIKAFCESLNRPEREAITTIVTTSSGMSDRLSEILREYEMSAATVTFSVGQLSSGFEIPSLGAQYVAESDIFGDRSGEMKVASPKTTGGAKRALGAFISDFRDLKQGDFVVHVDHGIGRFEGLEVISSQGLEREFLVLIYADNTKLFVPVERLDLVSRYSSGEATAPSLDRLGGLGWQKTKAKAKRAMRDMADELLRLYAERRMVTGHAFPADTPWQTEFEDSFPHQLTSDQAIAINDVKSDMERAVPMDRLIVGDVGYGKTEVAMRAAFKAVMDGKQVIVLTPTTVLAYQHAETFKKRFAAFPVRIELLSRFRSTKEQKAVSETAGKGEVDILIGTHRVLSSDVRLPSLGLVVVDEEQRFGVAHKEKLKQLKKKVDVLTLSATPIPRTLNMSLLGIRDLSVIETPPRDRLSINTQVVQFSESVIKSAIDLELARGGQVFFVHNRVETIDAIAAHIQKIVPEAKMIVAHGQMNEKEMEQAVLDFIDQKFNVLVATTIIENGIDIPLANTIIINRADTYGLSQLYQLRGRVGRSNRRAYAYLLIPSELELTPIARRRLAAIREFSDLGAGFRIAALDLELRGAGDILGGHQSGQIDALGFDLYSRMLERTIQELKGEVVEDEISVSMNLGIDVSIPRDYIVDTGQRLRTYKRISSARSRTELDTIRTELEDRYGRLPDSAESLLEYSLLRQAAEALRVISIDRTKDGVALKISSDAHVSPEKLMAFIASHEGSSFSPSGILRIVSPDENPIGLAVRTVEKIKV